MIQPDKLARSMVEATTKVIMGAEAPGGTQGILAVAINERLADDEAMERAAASYRDVRSRNVAHSEEKIGPAAMRAAIAAAFTESS